MDVIICGAGLLGYNTARYLIKESHNVTVVDKDPALIANINDTLDCRGIVGHASAPSTWEKIGGNGADLVIAVTRDDEVNMIACKIAHYMFQVPKKIARIREQSYLSAKWRALFDDDNIPIDVIISPEIEVADAIKRCVYASGARDIVPLHASGFSLVGVHIKDGAPILEDSIERGLAILEKDDVYMNVLAVINDEVVSAPHMQEALHAGQEVYFVCRDDKILESLALCGHEYTEPNSVLIIGGGNVGLALAEDLVDTMKVTVIDANRICARRVAERLPNSVVIHGDALRTDILQDAGLGQQDICISVTDNDEINMITAMRASDATVINTIALLKNADYIGLAHRNGVDVTVNPMEITGSKILATTRHGAVKTLYSLQENIMELLEIEIMPEASAIGLTLKDLKMPKGAFVGAIIRPQDQDNQSYHMLFPSDFSVLKEKDRVMMLASTSHIGKIIAMFTAQSLI